MQLGLLEQRESITFVNISCLEPVNFMIKCCLHPQVKYVIKIQNIWSMIVLFTYPNLYGIMLYECILVTYLVVGKISKKNLSCTKLEISILFAIMFGHLFKIQNCFFFFFYILTRTRDSAFSCFNICYS